MARRVTGPLLVGVAIRLFVTFSYVIQALLVAHVLVALFDHHSLGDELTPVIGIVVAIGARAILLVGQELSAQRTALAVKQRVRGELFEKVLELGPGAVLARQTGDLQTTLVDGVEALESYYGRYLPALVAAVVGPATIVVFLALHDLELGAVLAAFVVAVPALPGLWNHRLAEANNARWGSWRALAAKYVDSMQGIATLKAFGAGGRRRAEQAEEAERLRANAMRSLTAALAGTGITTLGVLGGAATVIGIGSLRVAGGSLTSETLFLALFLTREAFRPIDALATEFHTAHAAATAADQIRQLLQCAPLVTEPACPAEAPSPKSSLAIEMEDVTFTYGGRSTAAVAGLSLVVPAARTVAVVGASGAGKSTIVNLLLRFFEPEHGRILIGGRDIAELSSEVVRSLVSLISQDTYLFHGTIGDNIALARSGSTSAEVEAAARAAGVHEFIAALPDGYRTEVGERGLQLSGGQRQRVAIARAVLKDAPILLLDEATSSVDAANEAAIQDALARVSAGKTTLIIAHRLSTVRHADQIVVLAEGGVAETGDHEALLARRGAYAHLVAAQGAS